MTARQTIKIMATVLVAIVIGPLVQQASGWLWGTAIFLLIVVLGGTITRAVSMWGADRAK